jgi:hypothetical protein
VGKSRESLAPKNIGAGDFAQPTGSVVPPTSAIYYSPDVSLGGNKMSFSLQRWCGLAAVLAMAPSAALAAQLKVVNVAAPAVVCVFNTACSVTVNDSLGYVAMQALDAPKTARLQSRTFPGAAGTPAAGKTGYEYRLDLAQASGSLECLGGVVIDFGPVTQLPYANNTPADVYVVTQGGLGTIGIASAELDGTVITFQFDKLLCASEPANAANTTFFFGLASAGAPVAIQAGVFATGSTPYYAVDARSPSH